MKDYKVFCLHLCILLSVSFILLTRNTQAQFIYGVKAGLNVSYVRIDDGARKVVLGDFKPLPGFNLGFLGEFPVKDWLSIQFQVNYDMRGTNYYEEKYELGNRTTIDGNINLHYIELPLMVKFHKILHEKKRRGVHFKIGPDLAYLAAAKITGTQSFNENTADLNESVSENVTPVSLGFNAAAGFFFPVKHIRAFLEMRYCHGFSNIFQGTEQVPANELDAYGSVISVNFGMIGFSRWDKY